MRSPDGLTVTFLFISGIALKDDPLGKARGAGAGAATGIELTLGLIDGAIRLEIGMFRG